MTYEVGDIIEYIALGGLPRRVRVTNRESNIKNGRPGFDGEIVDGPDEGMTVWGYDEQVTKEEA